MIAPKRTFQLQGSKKTSVPTRKVIRATFFAMSVLTAFAAINSLKTHLNIDNIPLLKYQFFAQDNRALSKLDGTLFSYNNEDPIGAGQNSVMLLGIFSTTGNKYADRRRYIRTTYLSTGDDRICKLSEYMRQKKEDPDNVICSVPYTFVIGAGGPTRPTDHDVDDTEPLTVSTDDKGETDPEGDCTYLNIKENMEDGKSTTYMKFGAQLAKEYGIDYIAKTDDDSVVSDQLMLRFVADDLPPAPYNRRIYGGTSWASYAHSHMYAAGQFYFMSSDLADYVSNSLTVEKRKEMMHWRHTEDADMGTFVFSHPRPIKFVNLAQYKFWHHPMKTEKDFLKGWEGVKSLPGRGTMMPFWHLCSAWMKGQGV